MRWQEWPRSSRWVPCNHKGPYEREARESGEKGHQEQDSGEAVAGFADEGQPQGREVDPPLELPGGTQQTPWLQPSETVFGLPISRTVR